MYSASSDMAQQHVIAGWPGMLPNNNSCWQRTSASSSAKPLPMPSRASAASLICLLPTRILPFLPFCLLRCSWRIAAGLGMRGRAACSAISSSVAPPITFLVLLRVGRLLFGACLPPSSCAALQGSHHCSAADSYWRLLTATLFRHLTNTLLSQWAYSCNAHWHAQLWL